MDIAGGQLDLDRYFARPRYYVRDFTLAGNQLLTGQQVTLRGTESFFLLLYLLSTQTGPFRVQIYTTSGDRLVVPHAGQMTDRAHYSCLFGTAQRPGVLYPGLLVPGTGAILLDLEDLSGAENQLHLVFGGLALTER